MPDSTKFPIAGVGASAGGVQALQSLLKNLPESPGVALVVVTHLNPERESMLHEVLAPHTSLPVLVAKDNMRIERNNVYVMPSGVVLTVKEGNLQLTELDKKIHHRKPIDIFLASLAEDQGEYSVGIILSGGDSDGTLGVKAIREANGLTMAQAPDGTSPQNPSMPESAIETGVVDLAVTAEDMGPRLLGYARSFETLDDIDRAEGTQQQAELLSAHRDICALLKSQSGHDFSGYKTKTFFRRVRRRIQVRQLHSLTAYLELLAKEPEEIGNLFRDLLINVTNFFRDQEGFAFLKERVIPALFEGKGANDTIRIWVPGCATGEEVYSLAILIREYIELSNPVAKVQIFATDIDEHALSIARTGRYPGALLEGISSERRRRFFKMDGASYLINGEVRELCIFSPHSLIRDPPFSRMDMVSCRNLLIYFGPDIQKQVLPTFHYSLKPGGYLFLGSSENIGQHTDLFAVLDKKHRVFQAREHSTKMPRLPSLFGKDRSTVFPDDLQRSQAGRSQSLRNEVEGRILERFAPAHVVVNADADIVYYSAGTGRFLEPPQGAPSRQLLTLARKELRLELRSALRECVNSQRPVHRFNLVVEQDEGRKQLMDFIIEPIKDRVNNEQLYVVVFQPRGSAQAKADHEFQLANNHDSTGELERELRDTKERLQATIEEYETALEELKSSNEELVSVNEEFQSSNEELEASKEEAQSLNEELNTINAELNGKIEELDRANGDLRNLFESTQIATIFLDRYLVIRTFTPTASSFFNLRPADVGRPLTDLSSELDYPNLREDIQSVFATGSALTHQLASDKHGRHYMVRLIPYRMETEVIDGVIVTLVDVSQLAEAEQRQQVLVSELNHRVRNMLAVVTSLAQRTLETAPSLETFRASFLGRLQAMGRAYSALSHQNWKDASVRDIFNEELKPFGDTQYVLQGEDLRLKAQPSLSLAMVAHELTTNALKYGALSKEAGLIEVSWALRDEILHVSWVESGGPPVKIPEKLGFGFQLLHGEVEYRMQGKIETDYPSEGLKIQIQLPLKSEKADGSP